MTFLAPPDGPGVVYEFFAPFAHVEGKYEWCRIRSPTHGVFDVLILLGASTSVAATVYVGSEAGVRYMAERYPECRTFRGEVSLVEREGGLALEGRLAAAEGPLRAARMALVAPPQVPQQVPYGGAGQPVWGSKRFTCWGVDLVLRGHASGTLAWAEGREERIDAPAIVTMGSFGRIAPL
ncbi:MAG: hypothetical protein QOE90_3714 [Thermoplasmata archaeon]|nr:hypothetical protein [Thermoplasmata archaeon]